MKNISTVILSEQFNGDFVKIFTEPICHNETHLGEMKVEVLHQLSQIKMHFLVTSGTSTYFDHTINICKLQREKNSNLFIKRYFERNEKVLDLSFVKCPMEVGTYVIRKCQKAPNSVMNMPAFVPVNFKATVKYHLTAKVNRKVETIFIVSETVQVFN